MVILGHAFLLAACGDAPTTGGEIDADALPPLALEEELRIGSLDDPDVGFSRIGGVHVAPDGRMFVRESQDRQIRVYDPDGRLIRRVGRTGEGPGEFMAASRSGLVGDTLWVHDSRTRRFTLFNLDGELLDVVAAPGVTVDIGVPGVMPVQVYPAALLADGSYESAAIYAISIPGPTVPHRIPELLFDAAGEVIDTIGYTEHPTVVSVRHGDRFVIFNQPLPDSPIARRDGADSIVVTRSLGPEAVGVFEVSRIAPLGDTVFHRHFRYRPLPVSPAVRDSIVDANIPEFAVSGLGDPEVAGLRRAVAAATEFPEHHPPVSLIRPGEDGSLWIRREDDGGDAWRWIVLDPAGEPRGHLTLPKRTSIQWTEGGRLWAVERDDFDVPWLVRFRIRD